MDFFKSVFSSQPDPPPGADEDQEEETEAEDPHGSGGASASDRGSDSPGDAEEETAGGAPSWGAFSGLIKSLATRSETVIQTYRRDLEEFSSGLRKETAAIREAIRELPSSLEAGASVAQESLESVGQAIDDLGGSVWRGTAEIIAQGKDALLAMDADGSGESASSPSASSGQSGGAGGVGGGPTGRPYSRFEARILGIQSEPSTFSEEPDDAEDFRTWITGFQLAEKEAEIESLLAENRALEGNLTRLVPQVVDYDTFWNRYFYKVHKLRQAEDVRANLVKRVISRDEEEEDLSWEVDDEETPEKDNKEEQKQEPVTEEQGAGRGVAEAGASATKEELVETKPESAIDKEKTEKESYPENAAEVAQPSLSTGQKATSNQGGSETSISESVVKVDGPMPLEAKEEPVESCKDSDVSVVSSHPSIPEEDDLGWDEIEDLGDNDEKKSGVSSGSPSKIDLRKRFSAAEEDEDLSWDIEDDEPTKP